MKHCAWSGVQGPSLPNESEFARLVSHLPSHLALFFKSSPHSFPPGHICTFCASCLECFSLPFPHGNSCSSLSSQIALDLLREELSLLPPPPIPHLVKVRSIALVTVIV